nr:ATP-binding protein [Nocardia wallacei]
MTKSSFPGEVTDYMTENEWQDLLVAHFLLQHKRKPSRAEIDDPPDMVRDNALREFLRDNHAQQSTRLPVQRFGSFTDPQYLLSDRELRNQYGELIGKLAASHWWNESQLATEFDFLIGQPSGHPTAWIVDPLKLACLLRVADISHADATRAPSFVRAIRRIEDTSKIHWAFQENIRSPVLESDRLVYTSTRSFRSDESEAWWLCVDTLRAIDKTLRAVDTLLADRKRSRFAAKSVAFADDISNLSKQIPTDGWYPIDARIRVNDVIAVVKRLGGAELYGDNPTVALRELVINAADAIRARRLIDKSANDLKLRIRVSLTTTGELTYLTIEDNGIGMSADVLTGPLLDFGNSYWSSSTARNDLPGLLSAGFAPAGKFGIGFFSVFMIGDRITVQSRRFDASHAESHVLEFNAGLEARPILRQAGRDEVLGLGGTRIIVELSSHTLSRREFQDQTYLLTECMRQFPTLDVQLEVDTPNGYKVAVAPGDWRTHAFSELEMRLIPDRPQRKIPVSGSNFRPLWHDDEMVGRLAIAVCESRKRRFEMPHRGVVTVGGARSETLIDGAVGFLLGETTRAARDVAQPIATNAELARWATEQSDLISAMKPPTDVQLQCAAVISALNGGTGGLAIAMHKGGSFNYEEIREWTANQSEVMLLQDAAFSLRAPDGMSEDDALSLLEPNVLVTDMGLPGVFQGRRHHFYDFEEITIKGCSLLDLCLKAIAEAWDCPYLRIRGKLREQIDLSNQYSENIIDFGFEDETEHPLSETVGFRLSGEPWIEHTYMFRKSDLVG